MQTERAQNALVGFVTAMVVYDLSLHVFSLLGLWDRIPFHLSPENALSWLTYDQQWVTFWGTALVLLVMYLVLEFRRVE